MKLVQELPEIFDEFEEQRKKAFIEVKEYKEKGIPVVGMYCAYFPIELSMAVGAISVGLCSFSNDTIPSAERKLPKSMCPLVKSSLGFALEDKCPFFHFADLVIGETTCDGKKKMYEMMAEFKPVFVMELPNSQSESALEFWKKEVIRTKEYLEEFFQVVITEEKIKEAVHLQNRIRGSLLRLCGVMKLEPAPVLGADIQKIVSGSKYRFDFQKTPEVVDEITDQILEDYRQGKMLESRPRILVTGCPIGGDALKIIQAIEDSGGVVVAMENCSGVKSMAAMVDEEDPDVYGAIARRYLATGCSIMTPNDNRIELLGNIIDEYHVDGVVEMILSGCHATGAESAYIQEFATEEKGIPYLAITTDYSKEDYGQICTRISALLEMIYDDKAGTDKIDINYCYKLFFSNLKERKSDKEIFEMLYEYTKIPMTILDNNNQPLLEVGTKDIDILWEKAIKVELPANQGYCLMYPQSKQLQIKAEQIGKIIGQYFAMKPSGLQAAVDEEVKENNGSPDYLWLICKGEKGSCLLEKELTKDFQIIQKCEDGNSTIFLLAGIEGKAHREQLIALCNDICNEILSEVKIGVGNGFSKLSQKMDNLKIVRQVLEIGEEEHQETDVYLIENYYRKLIVHYMKNEVDEMDSRIEELEIIKEEDRLKNGNLYETLYCYLMSGRNMVQAAAKLKIHRNTLLYRIARINELIHLDERGYMESQRLLMAMQMEQMKESVK